MLSSTYVAYMLSNIILIRIQIVLSTSAITLCFLLATICGRFVRQYLHARAGGFMLKFFYYVNKDIFRSHNICLRKVTLVFLVLYVLSMCYRSDEDAQNYSKQFCDD